MSFRLKREPVVGPLLKPDVRAGAVAVFEGRVRNHNADRSVQSLEYEAFDDLAIKTGNEILQEAQTRFPIFAAACVHAIGHLQLGDVAIHVEVAAGHRGEAFSACRWIVDEVKRRVPIWKKEHYTDGDSDWINAHPEIATSEGDFYSRQTRLAAVDQNRLKTARVLVIGAGGLGSPVVEYLAGAGVGRLTIVDSDRLEESNLHRQVMFRHQDIGQPKAELAAQRAKELNPYIEAVGIDTRLDPSRAESLIAEHDLVIDCTDNFRTKFLLNDACIRLGRPLIAASIYQFEGHLAFVMPGGPCLRCLWPQSPDEGCVGSCAEVGVLGVVPGIFGTLQASEAIKHLLGLPSPLSAGRMLLLDLLSLDAQSIAIPPNPDCPTCGKGEPPLDIEVTEVSGLLIDIREDEEAIAAPIPHGFALPMSRFDPESLPKAERYVLVCERGIRSAQLARSLRERGDSRFFSLVGGRSRL